MKEKDTNETKKCKHCQTDIPKKAKVCPNCKRKQGGILKWIIVAVVVLLLFSCASSDDNTDLPSNSNPQSVGKIENTNVESSASIEVDNEFAVGEIVETSDLRITFISAEEYKSDNQFIQPSDGNVFYRMQFEFENISDSDQYVSSWDFTCYADSYDMKQSYFDGMDLDATLSKGKKTKGSVFFEVPKDATEITLEYEINFITEDKVVFVIK